MAQGRVPSPILKSYPTDQRFASLTTQISSCDWQKPIIVLNVALHAVADV